MDCAETKSKVVPKKKNARGGGSHISAIYSKTMVHMTFPILRGRIEGYKRCGLCVVCIVTISFFIFFSKLSVLGKYQISREFGRYVQGINGFRLATLQQVEPPLWRIPVRKFIRSKRHYPPSVLERRRIRANSRGKNHERQ